MYPITFIMNGIRYKRLIYKGIETNYLVSEIGDIYNFKTSHFLTPTLDSSGRKRVCISINGECYGLTVHFVVYLAFYGELDPGMTVNHINEDFLDNTYTNLEAVTRSENAKLYRINNGLPEKKYSDSFIEQICEDLKAGMYYKDVAANYNLKIQFVFQILKGRRRTFVSKKYLPFPESAHQKKPSRKLPIEYIKNLIQQKYSNDDILELIGLARSTATDKMFSRLRKKLGIPAPEYFDKEILSKVDCLISSGKCNRDIYKILGLEDSYRNANMIARERQRLGILNFNPDGVSLDDQNQIIDDILLGMTNAEIFDKWNLERCKYTINMMARLRQKVKNSYCEGSSTIEST